MLIQTHVVVENMCVYDACDGYDDGYDLGHPCLPANKKKTSCDVAVVSTQKQIDVLMLRCICQHVWAWAGPRCFGGG